MLFTNALHTTLSTRSTLIWSVEFRINISGCTTAGIIISMVKHLCTPIFATIQIPFGRIVKISDPQVSRHEFTEPLIVFDLYIFINFNFIFKINISPICLRSFIGILTNAGWSWLIDIINIMTTFLDFGSFLSSKVRINSL